MDKVSQSRRQWLTNCLFSGGLLGLRAIASGLPIEAIADPQKWLSSLTDEDLEQRQNRAALSANPQFLVLSASDLGEPMNCNVPGMYEGQGFLHPTADTMAQVDFSVGGQATRAAKCWTNLGASTLDRTCFFHHSTYSFAHGDLGSVHRLKGAIDSNEMMVSAFAKVLSGPLKSIQVQPITISGQGGVELISYQGVQQPIFSPTAIRSMLTTDTSLGFFAKSQALRDRDINAINALAKTRTSKAQADLIDSMVTSQAQARALPATLLAQLSSITDNGIMGQMKVAALLCQMRLAPVVVVHMSFGGDNHVDNDIHDGPGALPKEAADHGTAMDAITSFNTTLAAGSMTDKVTFATLTSFGRTNTNANRSGRAHNGLHTCNLIVGSNVKGSVVGGADMTSSNAPKAQAIDPATGKGGSSGSIDYGSTLASFGATLGAALGIPDEESTAIIGKGIKVTAALK